MRKDTDFFIILRKILRNNKLLIITMLLFDFDGTLADTFLLGSRLINEYADKFGYQRIDFAENKNKSARELLKMAHVHWWEIPRLLRFFRNQTVAHAPEIEAFQGIKELITTLHEQGIPMGILSTNTREIIDIFIEKHHLEGCFSYFRTEVSLFGKKRALRKARRQLKKDGHQHITYIGDELRDIEACRAVDMPIISCTWGFNSKEILSENNTKVVSNCQELREMIAKLIINN